MSVTVSCWSLEQEVQWAWLRCVTGSWLVGSGLFLCSSSLEFGTELRRVRGESSLWFIVTLSQTHKSPFITWRTSVYWESHPLLTLSPVISHVKCARAADISASSCSYSEHSCGRNTDIRNWSGSNTQICTDSSLTIMNMSHMKRLVIGFVF